MTSESPPNASERVYYPWFDGLRFVLAMVVMLSHDGALPWGHAGSFAVHVFFVLSGWLIGSILLDLTPADLPRFFFNRTLRIWVPYYVALMLLVTLSLFRDSITPQWVTLVLYKASMVYNLFSGVEVQAGFPAAPLRGTGHHFWSVNAEEQFYLGAPLLLVLLSRAGRRPIVWVALAAAFFIGGADYPGLSMGVLAAIVLKGKDWHRTRYGQIALILIALLCLPWLVQQRYFMVASPFVALPIVLLLTGTGRPWPVGEVLGGLSYPLYLNHWIGIFASNWLATRWHLGPPSIKYALTALVAVLFAWAHYQLIDKQIRQHRAGWYSPRAGRIAMISAYAIFTMGFIYGFLTVGRIV
jgi:peptidoglycan/LPS O-acetylase OafA/YrhL